MTAKTVFRCPYCKAEYKTFWGLMIHCRKHTRDSHCPVCKQYFKRMEIHLERASYRDDEHKIAYALLRFSRKKKHSKHLDECRDFAYEFCKVVVEK